MQHFKRRAQSLVEFALTAPLLVVIVVGIIELGVIFSAYIGLTNSAREATRAAAVYRYPNGAPLTSDVAEVAQIDAGRMIAFSEALTATLNPIISSDTLSVTLAYVPEPGATYTTPTGSSVAYNTLNPLRAGDTVSATLAHNHTVLFGMLGSRQLTIRATNAARIEPGGAR
jgi:Flp pilus assembly protein TadG